MSHLTRSRLVGVTAGLAVLLLASMVAAALVGPVRVDLQRALFGGGAADNVDRLILVGTRGPRILLAAVVGGALGVAGAALQGLLRNPLAEPHLIGVSGGAALGAVAAIVLGGRGLQAVPALVPLAAAAAALVSVAVIYRLALVGGRLHPYVLLLAGVVYNAFAGAVIMFANAVADVYAAQGLLFWLMGSLATQSYALVGMAALYVGVAAVWLGRHARALNLLALGEDGALHLGVEVDRTRRAVFVAAALLVGAVVAVAGMIGFVGLIVPHVMRLVLGADHRLLLPASLLGGAVFLVWADTLARTLLGPVELPVGVVTALCGGPFFVYLLKREGRRVFAGLR